MAYFSGGKRVGLRQRLLHTYSVLYLSVELIDVDLLIRFSRSKSIKDAVRSIHQSSFTW